MDGFDGESKQDVRRVKRIPIFEKIAIRVSGKNGAFCGRFTRIGPWIFLMVMIIQSMVSAQETEGVLAGQVRDKETGAPVPFANIKVLGTPLGTAGDSSGNFWMRLPPGRYRLAISSLGYAPGYVSAQVHAMRNTLVEIFLTPVAIQYAEEVVVYGDSEARRPAVRLNRTEALMERMEGMALIKRADFAWEPSIRGMSAAQIGVVIDGMKIFSACVDRMDPVTAYVEVENLKELDIRKGGFDLTLGASAGGTVNLVTYKPEFDRPLLLRMEAGVESASALRVARGEANWSDGTLAVRATLSVKQAGDFYAGGGRRIRNSGYRKYNFHVGFSRRWGTDRQLEFSLIGDEARDIGYPVLLMDARKTSSRILRLEYFWRPHGRDGFTLRSKIYYNHIRHWMDDFQRDVHRRTVMPGMYMPMFGETHTVGWVEEVRLQKGTHVLKLFLDGYRMRAFADMQMISLDAESPPAYLMNLGDVVNVQGALALDHTGMIASRWWIRNNVRVDFSSRDVTREFGRRALTGFWEGSDTYRRYWTFSASTSLEYQFSDHRSLRFSVASTQRMPSHMENYGFFLYNILDGYFYTGNPSVLPEWSRQAELVFEQFSRPLRFRMVGFVNDVRNYISGMVQSKEFKVYTNLSSVYWLGAEMRGEWEVREHLATRWSIAYTRGHNREFKEPLPLIPPLEAMVSVDCRWDKFRLALEGRFAAAQNRIATRTTLEDKTPGFVLLNLRLQFPLAPWLKIRLGMENVLDRYYHEHLSINNLPGRGRNMYLMFRILFPPEG